MLIESLLNRYQEQRVRLRDVHSDSEDGGIDDAVEVSAGAPGGYGLLSRTETHYTFGGPVQPEGFVLTPGRVEATNSKSTTIAVSVWGQGTSVSWMEICWPAWEAELEKRPLSSHNHEDLQQTWRRRP